ncbi:MAG: integrase core domain-containing protein, partial [Planctomycetota bacterium]
MCNKCSGAGSLNFVQATAEIEGRLQSGSFKKRISAWLLKADRPDEPAHVSSWPIDYNEERPHTSLGGLTPNEFATRSNQDQTQNR